MSSYLSNLLTQTTSRYNTLRRTLLSSEDDGDTEDDTHICRVLRAYYVEKGRQFPQWLPPDPNDRKSNIPQPSLQSAPSGYYTSGGGKSQYSGVQNQAAMSQRSSLSDLWDTPAAQSQQMSQPQSLRAARRPVNAPQSNPPPQARPLPSQRVGSHQHMAPPAQPMAHRQSGRSVTESISSNSGVGGGTAQDRLKARLWGAGRQSPPVSQVGAPNPYDQHQPQSGYGGNPYDTGGGGRRF